MIGIYKITNLINGKIYIGQSKNISSRWTKHRSGPFNINSNQYDSPLYKSIRKYGLENFSFEVIEECLIEELNDKEIYWINFYNSNNLNKGYNLTTGGQKVITFSKINEEEASQIISLLLNSSLSQEEIANKFNISQRQVSSINQGQSWVKNNLVYPLRSASKIQKIKSKNKKENTCIKCGKIISPNATLCKECSSAQRAKLNFSREELKNLIRTTPFTTIGKQYEVSDNAIRKWCKKFNLPYKKVEIKSYSDEEWELI